MVPLPVPPDLLHPEPSVRFRHHIILTPLMSVPEAPVHQNTGAIFPQHDIRLARQAWMIEPIPESPTPQKFPDKNLRFSIPAPYGRHIIMALFYGQTVRHTLYLQKLLSSYLISFASYMLLYMKKFRSLRNFSRIHCKTKNRQQVADDFKLLVPNSTSVNYIVPIP